MKTSLNDHGKARLRRDGLAAASLAAGVLAVSLTGCGGQAAASPEADGGAVRGKELVVRRGDLVDRVLLTGDLSTEEATLLITPNVEIWPLQITWLADDGGRVAAGDVVVEFDNSQLVTGLDDARARLYQAENDILSEKARAASGVAEAEFDVERKRAEAAKARLDSEIPQGLLSEKQHSDRGLAHERAELQTSQAERELTTRRDGGEADVAVKRIALDKTRSDVERAESSVDKLSLVAPKDGILILDENPMEDRTFRPGDNIWPGYTVARLPDLETMIVDARLFDVDDTRVVAGQRVEAVLDAFPDKVYTGRVREVAEVAEEAGRFSLRRFFRVKVELDEIDVERMLPGMSVKLTVAGERREDVLLVPRESVDWSAEEPRVRLADGSWATPVLGACNAWECAVEDGLEEGQRLGRAGGT